MKRLLEFVCAALLLAPGTGLSASSDNAFNVEELAEGVYLHRGQQVDLDSPARADSANIGFVVGARCVAVIDSGGAVATGEALATAIAAVTDKPVCYVINTHVHFDHVLGNSAFQGPDTQFAGHHALAEAMAANREFFAESFAAELGPDGAARVIGPGLLVDDTVELDLGQRVLVLRAVGTAHTTTDLTVHDRTSNTLWTGDLLFRDRMPILDGSLSGWLAWMSETMARTYTLVIPGHGAPDRDWPAGAQAQQRYLTALRDDTRAAIKRGLFIDEASASVASGERGHWSLGERAHALNVSRAFRELEWE